MIVFPSALLRLLGKVLKGYGCKGKRQSHLPHIMRKNNENSLASVRVHSSDELYL